MLLKVRPVITAIRIPLGGDGQERRLLSAVSDLWVRISSVGLQESEWRKDLGRFPFTPEPGPTGLPLCGPRDSGEGLCLRGTLEAPVGFHRPPPHQVLPQRRLPALGGQCENPVPGLSL